MRCPYKRSHFCVIKNMTEKKFIKIEPVQNGTTIDHIKAGKAIDILKILKFPTDVNMGIAMNVPSKRYGKKDIIFVEGLELSEKDIAKITLISPNATLNIIREGVIIKKINLSMPERFEGVLVCPNHFCISNHENILSSFIKLNDEELQCFYCELSFTVSELLENFYKKERERE